MEGWREGGKGQREGGEEEEREKEREKSNFGHSGKSIGRILQ